MASSSSLSSVVSQLVRASMGQSVGSTVTDEDLDRHVAELILKEAKQKEEKYLGKQGIRAYLPDTGLPENNLPKPNKRFLTSIIKNVDDHNTAILRTQARAAEEIREEREAAERKEKKARADEAAQERLRRLMGGGRRRSRERRSSGSGRGKERDPDDWRRRDSDDEDARYREEGSSSRSSRHNRDEREHRHRSHHSHRRHSSRGDDSDDSSRRSRHDQPSSSKHRGSKDHTSPRREAEASGSKTSSHGRTPPEIDASQDPNVRLEHDDTVVTSRKRPRSPSPSTSSRPRSLDRKRWKPLGSHSHSPSRSLPPKNPSPVPRASPSRSQSSLSNDDYEDAAPLPPLSSKMDKYFSPAYDPLLDVEPISASGYVAPGAFEGWDAMLELVRARKEDKAERKRREKEDGTKDKKKKKKDKEKDKGKERKSGVGLESDPGVVDVVYSKRGSIREWDVGKEVT